MPQTLLLRIPAPGQDETEWLSIDEAGSAINAKQRGPLSLAAVLARTAKVIALAPAAQILLAEPEFPPGRGATVAREIVPGPLAPPREKGGEPKPLENAVLYLTREDWTLVQPEFEALAGQF